MYVNNLFNFYEDYRVNGQYINRRGLINPYFGMEMNVSLKWKVTFVSLHFGKVSHFAKVD